MPGRRDVLVGEVLDDRYRIERRVARGGMSTVYLGTDLKLRRQVALKVLHPHLAETKESVERFEAEAISAARLSDPNVVNVYDQGVDGSEAYLVMEYVPGVTLRDVMRTQGAMAPRAALEVMEAILSGLAAAHEANMVHRDIKPENVLISADGRIKLADFGLSRAASEHTATGGLVGTVAYVSPELVTGRGADERTDIYACGILLYELLTGRQPYTGETAWDVAMRHVNETVPAPSVTVPELNEDFDYLVAWATEQQPDKRPTHAGDFLNALRHVERHLSEEDLDLGDEPVTLHDLVVATQNLLARTRPSEDELTDAGDAAGAKHLAQNSHQAQSSDDDAADNDAPTTYVPLPHDEGTSVVTPPPPDSDTTVVPEGGIPHHQLSLPDDTQSHEIRPGSFESNESGSVAGAGASAVKTGPRTGRAARKPSESVSRPGTKRKAWFIALIVFILVLGAGLGAWWFGSGPGAEVVVPDLRNQTEASAVSQLDEVGTHANTSEDYSATVAKGKVIATDPKAGESVRRYQGVNLVISRGPRMVSVPNLNGLDRKAAQAQLEEANLKLGKVTERHNEAKAGKIIEQSEEFGSSIAEASKVDVVVSSGPAPVEIPRVQGRNESDAKDLLEAAGFTVVVGEAEFSDTYEEGAVIRTSPNGGEKVERGSEIEMVVSKGPDLVEVPNVRFKSTDEARQILEDAGFEVSVEEGSFGTVLDNVVQQRPRAGEMLKRGSTVVIGVV